MLAPTISRWLNFSGAITGRTCRDAGRLNETAWRL
jgi:hypothetical protein